MAVATVDEYLSALEKSKLLASEQLAQAQTLAGESSDAADLARTLAREKLVSRWQAGTLLALGQRAQLRLGKYKLIEKLGKGGMGTVFLAEHVTMNRRVALKIVPRSIAEDRASLDRFFGEARAIAALDHPNIVQAYSVDNEMDRYFIVMEYVDGQDLQRLVETSGPLDFTCAANYIRQAAEGLAHAHARNLVHCDIKPSNLLVNPQGVIKILDLGLARLNRNNDSHGAAGEPAFGTVDYMAPEQGLGTTDFDHRADIYSLGCTLYFLLTGHPPFPEGTLAQRIVKHQTIEPRDILAERPDTPPKLVEICKRMMAKQPEDRYPSIQHVSAALAPLLGESVAASTAAPLAVKPIEETAPGGSGDDWLSALTGPSRSVASSNGAKAAATSGTMRALGKSGKHAKKVKPAAGFAAALAGLLSFGKTKLAWFNTTKRKIIGVICGMAALAAAGALAALPIMLSSPKPQTQAKTADTATALAGNKDAHPSDSSHEPEPAASEPVKEEPTPKAEPKTTTHPPKQPKETPKKPETKPETKPPAKPDIKPPTKPEVKPPAKPEPKPEVKPPVKPVEVAKQVSLDDLAMAVDLPSMNKDFTKAVPLGKLELGPGATLDVQLLGGQTIAKGNPKFELAKDGGGDSPGWSIQMTEKNKDGIKVAQVHLEGGQCSIQWTADAKDRASLLRFCGLQFASGTKKHFTALTAPKTIAPLPLDMDAAAGRPKRFSRDFALPDASVLRLQIKDKDLDKALPKHTIKVLEKTHAGHGPHGKTQEAALGTSVGAKGIAFVEFTKEKTPHVTFEIGFDVQRKDITIAMQGTCEVGGESYALGSKPLQLAYARANSIIMMNDNQAKNSRKPPPQMLQAAKAAQADFKALGELADELNQKATVPFCIYCVVGETDDAASRVVIFESGQTETSKAAGTKKPPRGGRQKSRITPDADELNLK